MEIIDESLDVEEKEEFKIDSDILADWALDKIKEVESEFKRFESVAKEKISLLQIKLDKEKEQMENNRSFFESKLREYFEEVDKKETKTQLSYKLPSGNLKMKKGKMDFDVDRKKLLEYAKENKLEELVKVSESFAWADFKKELAIQGNIIVKKETGEVVEIEGLSITEKPSEFKVEV